MTDHPVPIVAIPTADGDAGIYQTLAVMRVLARAAAKTPEVQELAARWTAGVTTPEAKASRLSEELGRALRFEYDPPIETLYAPAMLVAQINSGGVFYGDCDDLATLAAALGLSLGMAGAFVIIAQPWNEPGTPPFTHVFTVLYPRGRPLSSGADNLTQADAGVILDLTRPADATLVPVARVDAVWI